MPSDDTQPTTVGIETEPPSDDDAIDWSKAQEGVRLLLESIGEDPDDETLHETWRRRVPAAMETLSEGTREADKPELRTFSADADELVIKTGIPVYSLCSHHILPFHGTVHVAYRPGDEVVGLSKLARYVRWQSRRLTMQEQLTQDIAEGLETELDATGVVVEMRATHLCEAMRGVETASQTTTWATAGDITETDEQRFRDAIQREDS
jgi:GTP cyclohydrolase I